jgi:ankyrin repeat protein
MAGHAHLHDHYVPGEAPPSGLYLAAREGDISRVRALLSRRAVRGLSPDTCDDGGLTALHFAARAGHLSVVCALLSARASPHPRSVGLATRSYH